MVYSHWAVTFAPESVLPMLSREPSPTIVEAILNGQFPAHLTMKRLIAPFPMEWELQREHFFGRGSAVQDS